MADLSFGKYRVTQVLGRGGMAEVYQARDPVLDRKVAIKVIHPHLAGDGGFGERFRREARLVASLRHPHIVQLYDYDVSNGQPFMVMEYLDGGTLKERLIDLRARGETMPLEQIERLLAALASALDYAHARGAVHRDIKPTNILLTPTGEPVLTDFGIAKILSDAVQFTMTGGVVGTPAYMAPEQAANESVDVRTDLYSLGVVLYEMATGRVPFEGDSPTAVMLQHLTTPPPPPRRHNPALPEAVEAVILKALAKNPDERFRSVGELARAFSAAVHGKSALPREDDTLLQADPTVVDRTEEATIVPPAPPARPEGGTREQGSGGAGEAAAPPLGPSAARPLHPPPRLLRGSPSSPSRARWLVPLILVAVLVAGGLGFVMLRRGESSAAATPIDSATLRFRNGTAQTDEVAFFVAGLPTPEAGNQYEVWLVGDGGERPFSIGVPTATEGGMKLVYTSPEARNLLAEFDAAEVSLEPAPDTNVLKSETVVLRGTLPPDALQHIRHVLVAREDTPGNIGYVVGLLKETQALQARAEALLVAFEAEDLRGLKQSAEAMANLIEGKEGANYGDRDGNEIVADAGDGFGLLPNGRQTGYVQGTIEHAKLAAEQDDATSGIKTHAEHVQITARNVGQWAVRLLELTDAIIAAEDVASVDGAVREAVSLAGRMVRGQDLNGNEDIEPIPDEGAALMAFEHAQYMADINLSPVD